LCADNLISIRHSFSPTGLKNYVIQKNSQLKAQKQLNTARNPQPKKEIIVP